MINRVILVGRVGKEPEMREIAKAEGTRIVVNFPLATHELITDKQTGQKTEFTEWHTIEMWDKNAENAAKILKKGRVVYIEGKIKSESWLDKSNNKRYSTKIRAHLFQVLSNLGSSYKASREQDDSDNNSIVDDSDDFSYVNQNNHLDAIDDFLVE